MTRQSTPGEVLELSPLYIPGLIEPIQTPGAVGGINRNMIHANAEGLLVILQPYLNMQQGDWVEIFWGNDTVPVAADTVLPEHLGSGFPIFISAGLVPEGINELHAKVTRASNGNEESSPKMAILVRTLLPGGIDPEPGTPGHQNLLPPEPELPPSGIIDEDAAKNGIKVRIPAYPNIREFDTLTFSWGGVQLRHEVTTADIAAGAVELLVTEDVILEAGASDQLLLEYWIWDEVHNLASDWSLHTYVTVEVGEGLFDPPLIENPDPNADPYDVIDLEDLGDDDLLISVMVVNGAGLQAGDLIAPKWIGTTAQGLPIEFSPAPESVPRVPTVMTFLIPNAEVRGLAQGRGIASYAVSRGGNALGNSKRAFVNFVGAEASLPKPILPDAVDGVLAPTLASTTLIVPGAALEAGDRLVVTWLGTRANGSPLVHEFVRNISGGGAGQPVTLPIDGPSLLAPLDGGTLAVYYKLVKGGTGPELHSAREQVQVGEARAELPAPGTRPPAVDGVLDPAGVALELEIVVAPYPDMQAGQTVRLVWKASSGPAHGDYMPISPTMVGKEVVFYMDRATLDQYVDATVEVSYQVEEDGEPTRVSQVARFSVGARQEVDSGPMRVMGARFVGSTYFSSYKPRMLSALHDDTLLPMRAEWWYEGDEHSGIATEWVDEKPWLTLYVRNASETWKCNPANVVGNGSPAVPEGSAAFVAMRDEVMSDNGIVVDMVAWGRQEWGGKLDDRLIQLKNVVEISTTSNALAARLSDGNVACWGDSTRGGLPETIYGDFIQVRGNSGAFVGQKRDGELYAWGNSFFGVPVPERVLAHRDYVDICVSTNAFAARRATGHVVAWGYDLRGGQLKPGQELMDDIVQLRGGIGGFAALRVNGNSRTVISWGDPGTGIDIPEDIIRLTNIRTLGAVTHYGFSVILETGEVKVWGSGQAMTLPDEIAKLTNVVELTATWDAYCARLSDGTVAAWGHPDGGGILPPEVAAKTNIVQVTSNIEAFAALCADGTVVAWGKDLAGGDTSAVAGQLVDVRAIYPNNNGFCALTNDGRVVTWGVGPGGGDSSAVQGQLHGRVTARRLLPPTEAEAVKRGVCPATKRTSG